MSHLQTSLLAEVGVPLKLEWEVHSGGWQEQIFLLQLLTGSNSRQPGQGSENCC